MLILDREDNNVNNDTNHCHCKVSLNTGSHKARNKIIVACLICFIFTIVELLGGILADSLAILTDAAHLLTDFGSFGISLFSLYLANRQPTKKYTFGWHRAEVLGALASILLIWVLTVVLIYYAIQRLLHPNYDINASIMLITATFAVIVNVVMGLVLHPPHHRCHAPSHTHHPSPQGSRKGAPVGEEVAPHADESHVTMSGTRIAHERSPVRVRAESTSSSSKVGHGLLTPLLSSSVEAIAKPVHGSTSNCVQTSPSSIAVRAAYIHVLGDLVQSFGILTAAFLIYYRPEWKIADPICTFVFSLLVILTTFPILRDIVVIMMEGIPRDIKFQEFRNALLAIPGVLNVHDIKVWSLTMEKKAATFHLAIDPQAPWKDVLSCSTHLVKERFGIHHVTIQIEEFHEEMLNCSSCRDPKK